MLLDSIIVSVVRTCQSSLLGFVFVVQTTHCFNDGCGCRHDRPLVSSKRGLGLDVEEPPCPTIISHGTERNGRFCACSGTIPWHGIDCHFAVFTEGDAEVASQIHLNAGVYATAAHGLSKS